MELLKIVMLVILLMVLAEFGATTTATPTKSFPSAQNLSQCPTKCGDMNITDIISQESDIGIYPFGIGPGCFRQGFELICNTTYARKLFLADGTTEVYDTYGEYGLLAVKFYIHIMQRLANTYNGSWNPGRPFSTAYANDMFRTKFVVIGCWVDAYLLDENNMEIDNCSTTCKSDEETKRLIGHCKGIGCCNIPVDHQQYPIIFKINRDKENNKHSLENVKAFLYTHVTRSNSMDYTFSQEDLESTDTVKDRRYFGVVLKWSITDQPTCEKAKEESATYACLSNYSECTSNKMAIKGYTCSCSQNYDGNPYILDGCQGDLYFLASVFWKTLLTSIFLPLYFGSTYYDYLLFQSEIACNL